MNATVDPPWQVGPEAVDTNRAADLERNLLACCVWFGDDADAMDAAAGLLSPEDFAVHAHGLVFRECLALRDAGSPVTAATVLQRLTRAGVANELGPNAGLWLAELRELQPTAAYAGYFAQQVRDAATLRKLRHAANTILREATHPTGPAVEVVGRCEQIVFDVADGAGEAAGPRAARELVLDAVSRIDSRAARGGALDGLPTGFADLDELLGGLKPGQLIVLGARPGAGKTALALQVALNAAAAGAPALFASMEMPEPEIMDRALSVLSGVPLRLIQRGKLSPDQAAQVNAAGGELADRPFHLDSSPDLSAFRLASVARRSVRRRGVRLIVVDYLQLMRPENPKENRAQQVGLLARRVKQLARGCGVPVLLLCQLNRGIEARGDGKPKLADLRESGEIEAHADAVVMLSPKPGQPDANAVWLTDAVVAKNRNGPVGELTLAYRRCLTRFENAVR